MKQLETNNNYTKSLSWCCYEVCIEMMFCKNQISCSTTLNKVECLIQNTQIQYWLRSTLISVSISLRNI